ncbi:hypothetical protein [Sphingomonas sp.]|uniref:hypothetical protein n=1 Tax=Sphingomonas sp. TaxID=28214 RepID=UPI002DD6ABBA|nr:hypothetical protein [Sphingomonas sp.]
MNMLIPLLTVLVPTPPAAASPPLVPVAQARGDQDEALAARRRGVLPFQEIERRVIPQMPGARYLGFDFDPATAVYTLKFLRDGSMIWVMVDGRTGNILGRTGR